VGYILYIPQVINPKLIASSYCLYGLYLYRLMYLFLMSLYVYWHVYVALSETLGPNSTNVISSKMTLTSRHEKLAINCSNCQTLIMIQKKCRMFYKRELNDFKFLNI